ANRHENQGNTHNNKEVGTQQEEPVEVFNETVLRAYQKFVSSLWGHQGAHNKDNDQDGCNGKYRRVQVQPERSDIILAGYVIGLILVFNYVAHVMAPPDFELCMENPS